MTKDEWYNLCTRVQSKLPKHVQLDIWNLLAWRDKVRNWRCVFADVAAKFLYTQTHEQ